MSLPARQAGISEKWFGAPPQETAGASFLVWTLGRFAGGTGITKAVPHPKLTTKCP